MANLVPVLAQDRTLPVCIGFNEASVHGEALTADKARRNARGHDTLEYTAENITVTESFVAGARKCRMVRDPALDVELAKPTIGEVHLDLAA
jgi:hypothetical protein